MPILPPQMFLTPFTNPWERPAVGSASIGEYGEMQVRAQLERDRLEAQRQQAQAELSMNQARLGIQQQEVTGRNKYYEDQISARKEESGARQASAKEKQVAMLHAQLRKAAEENNQTSVEMIRQQLGAMGYASEEVPTGLEEPATLQSLGLPPDLLAAPGKSPGVKPTTPLDKGFQKTLGDVVAKEEATPEAAPQPMPWDMPGLEASPKKKKGGKFIIRDPQGNPIMEIDAPLERSKREKAISDAIEPFVSGATNEQERAAAEMARKAGVAASKVEGTTPAEAADIARKAYQAEMNRYFQEKRPGAAGAGGGGGGVSKQEQTKQFGMTDDTKDIIKLVDAGHKLPAAKEALGAMNNMDAALSKADQEGFAGGAAISSYLKAISGAQVSDKEADRIFGGAGKQTLWENEINKYVNGGRLPPDLIRGLQGVASRFRQVYKERSEEAAGKAEGMIDRLNTLASPEQKKAQKEAARGYFTGDFGSGGGGGGGIDPAKQRAIDAAKKALGR